MVKPLYDACSRCRTSAAPLRRPPPPLLIAPHQDVVTRRSTSVHLYFPLGWHPVDRACDFEHGSERSGGGQRRNQGASRGVPCARASARLQPASPRSARPSKIRRTTSARSIRG